MSNLKQKLREARYQERNYEIQEQVVDEDVNESGSMGFYEMQNTNATKLTTRYEKNATYSSSKSYPLFDEIDQADVTQQKSQKNLKKFLLKSLFSSDTSDDEIDKESQSTNEFKKLNIRFFLTCFSYGAGLSALWRFPSLLYEHGGGTFLVPYFIFMNFVGVPLLFLELNLGQYTSQSVTKCWTMTPLFKGIGISMIIASILVTIYYNMIVAYSIYYFLMSFRTSLDWNVCDHAWASKNCTSSFVNYTIRCEGREFVRGLDGICYQYNNFNGKTNIGWWNAQKRVEFLRPVLSTEEFFTTFVLEKSSNMNNGKDVVWQLALCLLLAWFLVFLLVFKGTKWTGKIVYFTSIYPFILLLIIGIFGWILPGAHVGIEFMVIPQVSRLNDAKIWFDALIQVLLTLGISLGGIIHLSSKNSFKKNTLWSTFVIQFSNTLLSIFVGFVIFGYVGNLAFLTGQNIDRVVSKGPQFVFVIFSYAVNQIPGAPFWSLSVFFMIASLGLVSQMILVDVIIRAICDLSIKLRQKRILIAFVVCACLFLLGLTLCTEAGIYWFVLYDKFATGWALILIALFECLTISWIYGFGNFQSDIRLMIGKRLTNLKLFWYWIIHWALLTPGLLLAIALFAWIRYEPIKYGSQYTLPHWAQTLGWLFMGFILSGIVLWFLLSLVDVLFFRRRSFSSLFNPQAKWGPLKTQNKRLATHLAHLSAFHNRDSATM